MAEYPYRPKTEEEKKKEEKNNKIMSYVAVIFGIVFIILYAKACSEADFSILK